MSTAYKYSIAENTLNQVLDERKLTDEIAESAITVALDYISTVGDELSVVFKVSISQDNKELLDYIVSNHDGVPAFEPLRSIITEDRSGTAGSFQMRGFSITAAPGDTKVEVISWPYPIKLLALFLIPANDGDEAMGNVAENTLIGALVQDAVEGDAEIHCSPTVFDHLYIGYELSLSSGDKYFKTRVVRLNKAAGSVELQEPVDQAFSAGATGVLMTIPLSYGKLPLKGGLMCECGSTALGGSYIPKDTPLRIHYTNNSDHESTAYFKLEYWY